MKASIMEIVSGMGILIAIFLFLSNADSSVSIIRQLGTTTNATIKTLQGR